MLALVLCPCHSAARRIRRRTRNSARFTVAVIDSGENPVPSGVVYLVNVKTQAVKTYIADESGNYRFSGLDPNADYELHAEHGDLTSPTRTVSSFNSSRDIEVILKLSRKKKAG